MNWISSPRSPWPKPKVKCGARWCLWRCKSRILPPIFHVTLGDGFIQSQRKLCPRSQRFTRTTQIHKKIIWNMIRSAQFDNLGGRDIKTLPEAQRTQDIESKTWIISKSWNECKFQFSTLSPPPLPGNHLCHLVHLPVILLAHHHLNDNRYLPMFQQHILSPTWSQLTSSNIPCSSCTTTLPTPLVISKPTLGSTTIY